MKIQCFRAVGIFNLKPRLGGQLSEKVRYLWGLIRKDAFYWGDIRMVSLIELPAAALRIT
ncbi:hypothetical protein VH13_10775 [Corynebacterium ulcerans]|nr:hypothetical protein VH13_10775 [Corynebacterium ulcerans]KKO85282.1 hypothetical protein VH15_10655 [Corynebacterium ulcerans]